MTGREFLTLHGDPAAWTDREFEDFEQVATTGDPTRARDVLARLAKTPPTQADHTPAA
ncbi:hypothetical protein [Streptomyces sp. NPDC008150]|uniref:hypothetical protein n=1 Tax=Streptomyces sp. NPDC008150 TaxID=3364816 RepID=UPI0036E2F2D9